MEQEGRPAQSIVFPISTAARLTGVPATTLRNWEKRYGIPLRRRTVRGNRRLYRVEDVDHVRLLAHRVLSGVPIRKAAAAVRNQSEPRFLPPEAVDRRGGVGIVYLAASLDEVAGSTE